MAPEDVDFVSGDKSGEGMRPAPQGLLDHLKPAPLVAVAQAYRSTAFDWAETQAVADHVESWEALLSRHGVRYGGDLLDGRTEACVDLVYHLETEADPESDEASLPLLMDALYELTQTVEAEWEVYFVERVVTRCEPDKSDRALLPRSRVFAQHIAGSPAPEEKSELLALLSRNVQSEQASAG